MASARHLRTERDRIITDVHAGQTVWLIQQDDGSWLLHGAAGGSPLRLAPEVMLLVAEAVLGPRR